jgi:hypothetical protein
VGLLPHLLADVTGDNLASHLIANTLLVAILSNNLVVEEHHSTQIGINQVDRGVLGLVHTNLNLVSGVGGVLNRTLLILEGSGLEVEGHLHFRFFLFYQACPDSFSISQVRLLVNSFQNFFSFFLEGVIPPHLPHPQSHLHPQQTQLPASKRW